ncbi:DUF3343 domain-containing protein [Oscillospiraceae bacterium PP1C4]
MATIDRPVLVVRSITNAMRGQKLLEQNGISAYVQRNTAPTVKQGCGYGLKISGDMMNAAIQILNQADIKVVEIQGR